jgi:hypothetical protein
MTPAGISNSSTHVIQSNPRHPKLYAKIGADATTKWAHKEHKTLQDVGVERKACTDFERMLL